MEATGNHLGSTTYRVNMRKHKSTLPIDVKQLRIGAMNSKLEYGTPGAAGIDLRACIDEPIILERGGMSVLIPTGIAVHIKDPNYAAIILPRSGLGHKEGVILGNGTGLIDSDYQGELFVSACARPHGDSPNPIIKPGDRIAQLVFQPIVHIQPNWVNSFEEDSERGEGGFGSTGKQ